MSEGGSPAGPDDHAVGVDDQERLAVLVRLLGDLGVSGGDIDAALQHDHLRLLLVEHLVMPEPPELDVDDAAAATGLPADLIARLWRSLGFADPEPGDKVFMAADVEVLGAFGRLLEAGVVEKDLTLQMARVIGSSLARISSALADALQPDLTAGHDADVADLPDVADGAGPEPDMAPAGDGGAAPAPPEWAGSAPHPPDVPRALFEVDENDPPMVLDSVSRVIDLVWRRHLQAEARARMVRDHAAVDPARRVVGFADLVGFTALSQQIEPHELATVVERFELIAYDTVVSRGGRVVKMIGDEVMFAVEDERAAVEIALTLARTYREDDELNDVRVGLAAGPVLVREGDLFGPVVNRASRIVNIAFPGTVVCSPELRDVLGEEPDLEWKSIGQRNLKDIGRLQLSVLRRAGEPGPPPSSRQKDQSRRAERREAAVELIDRRNGERRRRGRRREERDPAPDVGPQEPTP